MSKFKLIKHAKASDSKEMKFVDLVDKELFENQSMHPIIIKEPQSNNIIAEIKPIQLAHYDSIGDIKPQNMKILDLLGRNRTNDEPLDKNLELKSESKFSK